MRQKIELHQHHLFFVHENHKEKKNDFFAESMGVVARIVKASLASNKERSHKSSQKHSDTYARAYFALDSLNISDTTISFLLSTIVYVSFI